MAEQILPRNIKIHLAVISALILLCLLVVGVDSISSILLWALAGNLTYLKDNVVHFVFEDSAFDLACISVARSIILVACFLFLEQWILRRLPTIIKDSHGKRPTLITASIIVIVGLGFACFAYGVVKLGMIIKYWREDVVKLHIAYKILVLSSILFPLAEFIIGAVVWFLVNRVTRLLYLIAVVNNDNETVSEKTKRTFGRAELKRLVGLAQPEFGLMFFGTICLVIASLCSSVAPFFFGQVIDTALPTPSLNNCITDTGNGTGTENIGTLWDFSLWVVILVAVFTVGALATLLRSWVFTLAGERFVARLRKIVFTAVMKQEIGFFDMNRTGELISRLTSDTQAIQAAATVNISMLARFSLQMILSLGLMFWQSPKLTAVLLSVVPIVAIGAVQYGKYLKNLRKRFQDALARASSTAEETISNIRTVRSFSNDAKMNKAYAVDIDESYRIAKYLAAITGIFMGLVSLLMQGAAVLLLWYGAYLVHTREMEKGVLTSMMLYTLNLAMSFVFLSNLYGEFMQAVGASVRLFELMDRIPNMKDGKERLKSITGEVAFKNVHFSYPSRPETLVLNGVSFNVLPGQVVALVGPSGGGKSTIVNLIERFYELQEGIILLNGRNLKDLDPNWFRRHFGLVSQEPVLFACSIEDNIKFGVEEATMEEVKEAARQANAHDFISSFESGYSTMVGERGVRLSGGQKQRIAIARALLMNPELLLLDEATSALDAESEHLVQEAIDRAMNRRTVLVIAHRLSTVRNADKVIVVNQGQVVEEGSHDELLSHDGIYKKLVLRQLMAGDHSINDSSDVLPIYPL